MKKAGAIVAHVLSELRSAVKPGVTTKELDQIALSLTNKHKARPAFLNYPSRDSGVKPFSGVICSSVNEEVVHGIPGDRVLVSGDIISIDYGCEFEGFFGDSAITVAVGEVSVEAKKLLKFTEESLYEAIKACRPGNRIGDIGFAVQSYVEKEGLSVIRDFVGHGIGRDMHEEPAVPNYGSKGMGRVLKAGMVLAIEPMISSGSYAVEVLSDGWTAVTKDRSNSAHFEHTVAITENGAIILTQ